MNKFHIYCLSVDEYTFFKYLPKNIIPLILNDKKIKDNYLNGSTKDNIHHLNKYLGEFTGIYWVYKNKINEYNDNDLIGFCQNRRFFLNDEYIVNHKINSDLFSKLLSIETDIFNKSKTIMVTPQKLKNENIYDHFKNNHSEKLMKESFKILDQNNSKLFQEYLKNNEYSVCNMFITRVNIFKIYCKFIFPFLNKILEFCLKENLCQNKNIRLPAFFIERFTSFWFHNYFQVDYLPYAVLNRYYTSDYLNKFYNTLKTPYCFRNFPTKLDI